MDTSSKLLVKKTSEWSYKEETWKGEVGSLEEVRKMITEGEGELRRKEVELQEGRKEVDKLEEDVKQVAKEEAAAERAILTGSGDGGEGDAVGSSVADQINAARRGICAADTEIEQTQLRLSHIREEWKMKTMALKNDQSALERIRREQSTTEKGIQQVKLKLHELDYDKEEADRIRGQKVKEEKELERLRERHEELSVKLSAFEFQYENPEKNFDRNKVKGFVASLLTVKNPEYSTAIEVTAGGRLYQVRITPPPSPPTSPPIQKKATSYRLPPLPQHETKHLPSIAHHKSNILSLEFISTSSSLSPFPPQKNCSTT